MGILLKIDDNTLAVEFGHYARVLIDVDLASQLLEYVSLSRAGGGFTVSLFYDNILDLCNVCSSVGHATTNHRRLEVNVQSNRVQRFLISNSLIRWLNQRKFFYLKKYGVDV